MSGLWTPGQRQPGAVEVSINSGPQGSILIIKGLAMIIPPDGGISTMPMQLESLEGIAQTITNVIAGQKQQLEAKAAAAKANGDGGVVLSL